MICRDMIDTRDQRMLKNAPISADQLYEYADHHKIFESFNGMVCAGSTKKIMEFLEFCTAQMEAAFSTEGSLNQNGSSPLSEFIDDAGLWYRYALASIELDCFIKIERRRAKSKDAVELASDDQATIGIYQEITKYCLSLMSSSYQPSNAPFASGSLERQNEVLGLLGRTPIKAIKRAQLDAQLGYD